MGDSKSTNKRVLFSWLIGLVMTVQEIFVLLWLPSTKFFFLTVHYFNALSPSPASWAGSRAGSPVSGEPHCMAHFSPSLQTKYKLKDNFSNTAAFQELEVPCCMMYIVHLYKYPCKPESIIEKYRLHRFCTFIHFYFKG
jgi:hypothetical protein